MRFLESYARRLKRKRWRLRAIRKRRELRRVTGPVPRTGSGDILLFAVLRNERERLAFFLQYYRNLGITRFFFVDNGSTDGSLEYLAAQPDCAVWRTGAGYKSARFGVDWLNWLRFRHAHDRWTLTVDIDEFFVYPFCDTRPLPALTDWLDGLGRRAMGCLMLDMYPRGPIHDARVREGENPFDAAPWFDSGNYTYSIHPEYRQLWIQGGPRARSFFADDPYAAPALNKIPLVRWNRRCVYVGSTHMLLPRGLNTVYDTNGGEFASGCLLHTKFLDDFGAKASEEIERRQHFAGSREYIAYNARASDGLSLWTPWSERYVGWRQLEMLGLISKGSWV